MPVNNGKYTPPVNNWHPAIDGRPMDPAGWNTLLADLSEALSSVIYKDGQSKMTGNLDMGSHRIIKLGKPQLDTDALRLKMLEKGEDIPSSETIDLPVEGMLFVITGDHDISTITSQFDGKVAFLQFEDSLSLIASESLILPGPGNYITSVNEVMLFVSVSANESHIFTLDTARADLSNVTQADARLKVGTGTMAYRNATISTNSPSGGSNGDVWFQV